MSYLASLFQSNALYDLPSWNYLLLYILDVCVFVYGFKVIARRSFPFSAYTLGYSLLAIPDIILYPTDRSRINIYAIGDFFYDRYMRVIDHAFVVTSVGFWTFVFVIRFGKRRFQTVALGSFSRSIRLVLFSDQIALLLLAFQVAILFLLFVGNARFGAASVSAFENTSIRPVVVVGTYLATFNLTILFARVFAKRSGFNIFLLISSLIFASTLGERHAIFIPLVYFIVYYAWWNRDLNFIKYTIYGVVVLILVQVANLFRHNALVSSGLSPLNLVASIFYANNFSDLRDFALILSGWDGGLLLGKTYVAAILGFVPSFLFPLRQEWNIGPITLQLSDFLINDPNNTHPGFRGTFIGEPYLNFGYAGVVLLALIWGLLFLYDYAGVQAAINKRDRAEFTLRIVRYQIVYSIFNVFSQTAGFSYIYFVGAMLVSVEVLRRVRR